MQQKMIKYIKFIKNQFCVNANGADLRVIQNAVQTHPATQRVGMVSNWDKLLCQTERKRRNDGALANLLLAGLRLLTGYNPLDGLQIAAPAHTTEGLGR